MLCQLCSSQEAAVRFSQVVAGKKIEWALCKSCAEDKGLSNPLSSLPVLSGGLTSVELAPGSFRVANGSSNRRCDRCGMTYRDFEKTGLLGCAHCYTAFERELQSLLLRVHGSSKHIGSRPVRRRVRLERVDLQKLREELREAIAEEDFERAAQLRDVIRDIERGLE